LVHFFFFIFEDNVLKQRLMVTIKYRQLHLCVLFFTVFLWSVNSVKAPLVLLSQWLSNYLLLLVVAKLNSIDMLIFSLPLIRIKTFSSIFLCVYRSVFSIMGLGSIWNHQAWFKHHIHVVGCLSLTFQWNSLATWLLTGTKFFHV